MAEKSMSFLPEDYVERRIEQRTNMICLSLFAIVLVGTIGGYFVTIGHRSEVRAKREAVNKSYAEAARRIEQLEQLQKRKTEMVHKAQVSAGLVEPVPRTFLLADLVNRMPAALSLLDLQLSSRQELPVHALPLATGKTALATKLGDTAKPGSAADAPAPTTVVSLALIGVAPTDVQVAQYMSSLSQSKLVADVNLVFSEETRVQDSFMRKFRIEMTLQPGADVRHLDPLQIPRKIKADPMKTQTARNTVITPQTAEGEPDDGTPKDVPLVQPVTDAQAGEK